MPKKAGKKDKIEIKETPIEALDLSAHVINSLKRTGIRTVGDVLDLLEKGETAVMSIRNLGEKSLEELQKKLIEKGYLKEITSSNKEASTFEEYLGAFSSTGAQIGNVIDDIDNRIIEIGEIVDEANIKNEIEALKNRISNLTSIIYESLEYNLKYFTAAIEVKNIPRIEQRMTKLEEAFERKRNWGLNIWLLVITVVTGFFGCISTIVAIWALFLR